MLNPNRLTIKSRLLLILLFITISSVLFLGVLAYRYAQQTIRERILAQPTSVRVARTYEIQSYLDAITKQITTVSQDDLTARALAAFSRAFDSLETSESISLRESEELELSTFYEETFLPRLEENSLTELTLETYLPSSLAGRYLQYHYIAANPNPLGEKDKLVRKRGDDQTALLASLLPTKVSERMTSGISSLSSTIPTFRCFLPTCAALAILATLKTPRRLWHAWMS